ncbi:MAG TPA: GNAT family N-acetyltransferase [Gaiellaceae bacterium]|nr:GNAT family N-acetyltransferase [Gaiellaceae bacterium]
MTTLRTERLLLRPPTLDDVDLAGELLGDERVMRFLGGGVVPREAWPVVVEKWLERWRDNDMGVFLLEHDGRFVGRCGILMWDTRTWTLSKRGEPSAVPELGWTLAYDAWGNGYATEAARAVRD